MRQALRQIAVAVLIPFLLGLTPTPALSAPILTQLGGNKVVVSEGQSIETLVAVASDAQVAGSVSEVVLVINGDIYLEPSAKADLVIDLGGHVSNQSKNKIEHGIFELNFTLPLLNNFFFGGALLLGVWFTRVLMSLFAIVSFTLLSFALKDRFSGPEKMLESEGMRLFGIGTVSALVIAAVVVLLSLTVIGIPLAILVLFLGIIGATLGILPIIALSGEKIMSPSLEKYPALTRILIHSTFFVSLANLPFLGLLVALGAGITGLGLALTLCWMYLRRRRMGTV